MTTIGRTSLAEAPAETPVAPFNVRTYGATGNGKTLDTAAVNRAIVAISAVGEGRLFFPRERTRASPFG